MRMVVGTVPVVILYFVQKWWVQFETLQLWVALATLPVTVLFILLYLPERPWGHWFGTSLLLLAIGVLSYTLSVVLFRIYGPDYWGRSALVVCSVGMVLVAMFIRLCVLHSLQSRVPGPEVRR